MPASNELISYKLRWTIAGCFTGLVFIMVVTYINSPKIVLNESIDQPIDIPEASTTPSIEPKASLAASSSAHFKGDHQQPQVQSETHGANQSQPTPPSDLLMQPTSSPSPTPTQDKDVDQCDFSLTTDRMIFAISVAKNVKVYFTPAYAAYKQQRQQYRNNPKLIWYCTEKEARRNGYKNILQLPSLWPANLRRQ